MKGFFRIMKPIIKLIKKNQPFNWGDAYGKAFKTLKDRLIAAFILHYFDLKLIIYVECDASDFINDGILSQKDKNEIVRPMIYFLKIMAPIECNYDIYNKELLAIIKYLKEWRAELKSYEEPIKILTDYKSLKYFYSTKRLN